MWVVLCSVWSRASYINYSKRLFFLQSQTYSKSKFNYSNLECSREKIYHALEKVKYDNIQLRPFRLSAVLFGKSFSQGAIQVLPLNFKDDGNIFHPNVYGANTDSKILPETYYPTFQFAELYNKGIDVLERYVNTGDVEEIYKPSLLQLLYYLRDIEYHEKSLMMDSWEQRTLLHKESVQAAILANHLLSRLVSNQDYILNEDNMDCGWRCPCEQKRCIDEIRFGNTSIGYEELWYGKPDMVLFRDGIGGTSVFTKSCVRERDLSEVIEDEKMYFFDLDCGRKNVLRYSNTMEQCITQCISFSFHQSNFAQKNNDAGNDAQVTVIPTIAIALNELDIYMYDYKHDILLRNDGPPIPLWDHKHRGRLRLSSIIYIWLTINHLLFHAKIDPTDAENLEGSCNFHNLCGDKLQILKENMNFTSHFSTKLTYSEKAVPMKKQRFQWKK